MLLCMYVCAILQAVVAEVKAETGGRVDILINTVMWQSPRMIGIDNAPLLPFTLQTAWHLDVLISPSNPHTAASARCIFRFRNMRVFAVIPTSDSLRATLDQAGVLHDLREESSSGLMPERSLQHITPDWMVHNFMVNTVGPAMVHSPLHSPRP